VEKTISRIYKKFGMMISSFINKYFLDKELLFYLVEMDECHINKKKITVNGKARDPSEQKIILGFIMRSQNMR
jgi:hypothetical protein